VSKAKSLARTKKTKSGASSVSRSGTLEGTLCLEIMSLSLRVQKTLAELVGTHSLEWWLENLQNAKFSWLQKKNLLVPILHV
jgi:hypothetical protein